MWKHCCRHEGWERKFKDVLTDSFRKVINNIDMSRFDESVVDNMAGMYCIRCVSMTAMTARPHTLWYCVPTRRRRSGLRV